MVQPGRSVASRSRSTETRPSSAPDSPPPARRSAGRRRLRQRASPLSPWSHRTPGAPEPSGEMRTSSDQAASSSPLGRSPCDRTESQPRPKAVTAMDRAITPVRAQAGIRRLGDAPHRGQQPRRQEVAAAIAAPRPTNWAQTPGAAGRWRTPGAGGCWPAANRGRRRRRRTGWPRPCGTKPSRRRAGTGTRRPRGRRRRTSRSSSGLGRLDRPPGQGPAQARRRQPGPRPLCGRGDGRVVSPPGAGAPRAIRRRRRAPVRVERICSPSTAVSGPGSP